MDPDILSVYLPEFGRYFALELGDVAFGRVRDMARFILEEIEGFQDRVSFTMASELHLRSQQTITIGAGSILEDLGRRLPLKLKVDAKLLQEAAYRLGETMQSRTIARIIEGAALEAYPPDLWAQEIAEGFRVMFEEKSGTPQGPWKPLAPHTIYIKAVIYNVPPEDAVRPLIRTRRLFRSLATPTMEADDDMDRDYAVRFDPGGPSVEIGLRWGTRVPYARLHHEGIGVPQRPILLP